MGFYVRKSLKAGPFRVNLSKSGVGVSAGVPGLRVGHGPRGNYVHMGRHGVYYRASLGGTRHRASRSPAVAPGYASPPPPSEVLLEDVAGATAHQISSSSSSELLAQINAAEKQIALAPILVVVGLIVALAVERSPVAGGVVLLVTAMGRSGFTSGTALGSPLSSSTTSTTSRPCGTSR